MQVNSINDVTGDIVSLKVTNKNHILGSENQVKSNDNVVSGFADMFNSAFNDVNNLELKSNEMTKQLAVDPDSVNIEDVQIATEESEMAILFTKGIVDRVIRAYKDITNLR